MLSLICMPLKNKEKNSLNFWAACFVVNIEKLSDATAARRQETSLGCAEPVSCLGERMDGSGYCSAARAWKPHSETEDKIKTDIL